MISSPIQFGLQQLGKFCKQSRRLNNHFAINADLRFGVYQGAAPCVTSFQIKIAALTLSITIICDLCTFGRVLSVTLSSLHLVKERRSPTFCQPAGPTRGHTIGLERGSKIFSNCKLNFKPKFILNICRTVKTEFRKFLLGTELNSLS